MEINIIVMTEKSYPKRAMTITIKAKEGYKNLEYIEKYIYQIYKNEQIISIDIYSKENKEN